MCIEVYSHCQSLLNSYKEEWQQDTILLATLSSQRTEEYKSYSVNSYFLEQFIPLSTLCMHGLCSVCCVRILSIKNYLLSLESVEGATATTAAEENEEFDWQVEQKLPEEVRAELGREAALYI